MRRCTRRCTASRTRARSNPNGDSPRTTAARSTTRSPRAAARNCAPSRTPGAGTRPRLGKFSARLEMRIPAGARRVFRLPDTSDRLHRDLDDEIRFHVDMRARQLIERGTDPETAYAEALRRFGDVDDLRGYCQNIEDTHMARAAMSERLESVKQDLRFALRQVRRAPAFSAVAALTLALGIGSTSAIFSVVNGVVLEPLPFDQSDRIVQVWAVNAKGSPVQLADPTFDVLAQQNRSL